MSSHSASSSGDPVIASVAELTALKSRDGGAEGIVILDVRGAEVRRILFYSKTLSYYSYLDTIFFKTILSNCIIIFYYSIQLFYSVPGASPARECSRR